MVRLGGVVRLATREICTRRDGECCSAISIFADVNNSESASSGKKLDLGLNPQHMLGGPRRAPHRAGCCPRLAFWSGEGVQRRRMKHAGRAELCSHSGIDARKGRFAVIRRSTGPVLFSRRLQGHTTRKSRAQARGTTGRACDTGRMAVRGPGGWEPG